MAGSSSSAGGGRLSSMALPSTASTTASSSSYPAVRSGRREVRPNATPLSLDLPTKAELSSTEALRAYIDRVSPLETDEQRSQRERVLLSLTELFRTWIRDVCVSKGVFSDVESATEAGGMILVSGSYRYVVLKQPSPCLLVGVEQCAALSFLYAQSSS